MAGHVLAGLDLGAGDPVVADLTVPEALAPCKVFHVTQERALEYFAGAIRPRATVSHNCLVVGTRMIGHRLMVPTSVRAPE